MLYEDPTKEPSSEQRYHVELHFSPGVNCCVQKNLPPGPGFHTHQGNETVRAPRKRHLTPSNPVRSGINPMTNRLNPVKPCKTQ